jgi:hypothetical protein
MHQLQSREISDEADQIWVFGAISNGVLAEILLARKADKPIHYYRIEKPHKILSITAEAVEMEEDVKQFKHLISGKKIHGKKTLHS